MRKDVLAGAAAVGAALVGGARFIICAKSRPRSPIIARSRATAISRSATIRR